MQRGAIQGTYRYINWDFKFLPSEETLESLQEKKEKLKMISRQTDPNPEEEKRLMKLTICPQQESGNMSTRGKKI